MTNNSAATGIDQQELLTAKERLAKLDAQIAQLSKQRDGVMHYIGWLEGRVKDER